MAVMRSQQKNEWGQFLLYCRHSVIGPSVTVNIQLPDFLFVIQVTIWLLDKKSGNWNYWMVYWSIDAIVLWQLNVLVSYKHVKKHDKIQTFDKQLPIIL